MNYEVERAGKNKKELRERAKDREETFQSVNWFNPDKNNLNTYKYCVLLEGRCFALVSLFSSLFLGKRGHTGTAFLSGMESKNKQKRGRKGT